MAITTKTNAQLAKLILAAIEDEGDSGLETDFLSDHLDFEFRDEDDSSEMVEAVSTDLEKDGKIRRAKNPDGFEVLYEVGKGILICPHCGKNVSA